MYLYKLCVNELEELDFKKERKGSNQSGVWHQIERTFHFLPFAKIQNNVTIHTQQYIVILRISPKSAYLLKPTWVGFSNPGSVIPNTFKTGPGWRGRFSFKLDSFSFWVGVGQVGFWKSWGWTGWAKFKFNFW